MDQSVVYTMLSTFVHVTLIIFEGDSERPAHFSAKNLIVKELGF